MEFKNHSKFDKYEENFILFNELSDMVPQLPQSEQDVLIFYYDKKMNQKDIARILGITQGAIAIKLKRAQKRLIFLNDLKKYDFEKILKDLEEIFDPFDVEIAQEMIKTTCQSEVAWRLNYKYDLEGNKKMTQVKIRHRFNKVLEFLKHRKRYMEHYNALLKIKENPYILHEINLSHFDRRPL